MSASRVITEGGFTVDEAKGLLALVWRIDGKRYVIKTKLAGKTRREAERALQAARRERIAEVEQLAGLDPTTMAGLAADWLDAIAVSVAESTLDNYRRSVEVLVEAHGHISTLDYGAEPALIEGLLRDRAAAGIRPSSNTTLRYVANAMCRLGVKSRRMTANPVAALGRTPKGKATAKPVRFYTVGQYVEALDYLVGAEHDQRVALVATLMLAGLRSEEARALTWLDIDRTRGLIVVNKALTASGRIGPTKTKAGTRVVPMAPELRAILVRQAEAQLAAGTYRADGLVFPSPATGGHLPKGYVTDAAIHVARQTGLVVEGTHLNPHGYRHTFATMALETGATVHEVAALLGHANAEMVVRLYGHAGKRNEDIDMSTRAGAAVRRLLAAQAEVAEVAP